MLQDHLLSADTQELHRLNEERRPSDGSAEQCTTSAAGASLW
jgi:hypothetical protein